MSTTYFCLGCILSSTTKILSPYKSGSLILVPIGKKFAAATPSRTVVPEAVIKGESSVCHVVEEYAVTTTETVRTTRSGPLGAAMGRRLDPW